mgnify:CR=1 FL=1
MIYYLIQIDENEGFYTYLDVKGQYSVGEQVIINFAGRKKTGLIVAKDSRTEFAYEVKPIIDRAEGQIKISPNLMKLFFWMKEYYLCSFRDILNASYPQNLKVKYKKLCSLNDNFNNSSYEYVVSSSLSTFSPFLAFSHCFDNSSWSFIPKVYNV